MFSLNLILIISLSTLDFVKYGSIKSTKGDVVFMYSDGLADEVSSQSNDELPQSLISELFIKNAQKGNNDRTCLRISVN